MSNKSHEEIIEESWDEHSILIGTDISDLDYYAGRCVITESQFKIAARKLIDSLPSAVTGGMKWVKASERLPEQYVCCRIPAEKIDYVYFNSSAMIGKLSDVDPNLEWLDEGQPAQECPRCHGEGEIEKNIPGNEGALEMDVMVGCPECGGTGIENNEQ